MVDALLTCPSIPALPTLPLAWSMLPVPSAPRFPLPASKFFIQLRSKDLPQRTQITVGSSDLAAKASVAGWAPAQGAFMPLALPPAPAAPGSAPS